MTASDLLTPRQLAAAMGMPYSTMMRWLHTNRDRIASCGFQRGSRWEYSRSKLIAEGVIKEPAHA